MALEITVLGSGSAKPTASRHPSAHAVMHNRQLFLVDCGEGTQMQMCRFGLPIENVRAIFLTHLHADHSLGLFGLLASMSMSNRRHPIDIYAHASFAPVLRQHVEFFIHHLNFEVRFHGLDTEGYSCIYEDRRLLVHTVPLRHRIATTGFIFREKTYPANIRQSAIDRYSLSLAQIAKLKDGHDVELASGTILSAQEALYYKRLPASYAYLSDTLYTERALQWVEGVDLLYHEATYLHDLLSLARETGHSTARQAGQFARKAHVGKLIIGHYSARYPDALPLLREAQQEFPKTSLAREGEVYRVANFSR